MTPGTCCMSVTTSAAVTGATAQLNQVLSAPLAYLLNGAVQPARLLLINSVGVKVSAK
jgi:hypothetical protein